jgi:hypothetical protein
LGTGVAGVSSGSTSLLMFCILRACATSSSVRKAGMRPAVFDADALCFCFFEAGGALGTLLVFDDAGGFGGWGALFLKTRLLEDALPASVIWLARED